nr:uncharacterized protein LOC113696453 [Coffea arabica]
MKGFLTTYTNWIYHGEDPWDFNQENVSNGVFRHTENDDINELIHKTLGRTLEENSNINLEELRGACDEETNKFFKLLKHAETELYLGCKNFTLLSFVIKLLHVKSLCRWSNNSMTILLELLKEVFPENELFPSSYRDAWKIVKDLGLSYHKIHACPNNCLIYWKETEHEPFAESVELLEERIKDRKLRHPTDSLAWKHFNDWHPSFASDPRNVRLGLAADGFNPFKAMNNKYSTWPQTSFMLCLLIDGPKAPGNDIHIYLQPVIDELNEFWDPRVSTYDAATIDHSYRLNRAQFDGTIEKHSRPVRLYGFEILEQLRDFRNEFGKDQPVSSAKKRKRRTKDNNDSEQKFLGNLLWTLLGMGKTNDDINARYDLKEMGIRKALHPQSKGDKVFLPPVCFTMSKDEKEIFCNVLKTVKVLDGYASNISRIIIELRDIFRQLYSKVLTVADCETLEDRTPLALCELEKMFPPLLFNIMEHLLVHLPEEAKLGGTFQFRSMYPIERYLCTLKNYVRSRSHPEGSIAEGFLAEECMTFCSMYLDNIESKLNRPPRTYEGEYLNRQIGRPLGKEEVIYLDDVSWVQAHRYVLGNLETVDPFRREHKHLLKLEKPRMSNYEREKIHSETFYKWFKKHVEDLEKSNSCHDYYKEIAYLVAGPDKWAKSYSGYIVNGFRFHTKKREMRRILEYYGVLVDIVELRYSNDINFVMFKCDWVDDVTGMKQDEHNFTLVNFDHILYKQNTKNDEPFILGSQAQQTWYVRDALEPEWNIVVKMTPRDLFIIDPEINICEDIPDEHSAWQHVNNNNSEDSNVSWVREGVDGVILDAQTTKSKAHVVEVDDGFFSDEDNLGIGNTIDDTSDDDDFFDKAQQGDKADD